MGWSRVSRLGHRRAQRKPRSGHGEKTATRLRLRRTPPRWHVGPLASRADSNGSAGKPALTHTQDSPHGAHCGHASCGHARGLQLRPGRAAGSSPGRAAASHLSEAPGTGRKSNSLVPGPAGVTCGPLEKHIFLPSRGTKAGEERV